MNQPSIVPGCAVVRASSLTKAFIACAVDKIFRPASLASLLLLLVSHEARAQRPLGTDVSGYQPSINWTTVKNGGVSFAWAKATESTTYVNPYYSSQVSGSKGVGIYIGAYHFARPNKHPNVSGPGSAESEAAYFLTTAGKYITNGGAYLTPMLDWEDPLVTNQLSTATMSSWVNKWCVTVSNCARAKGVIIKPVVYTGTWYSTPSGTYAGLNSTVTGWYSWIATYPSNPDPQTGGPSKSTPWSTWNIWQYADTNWSGGDSDVYNGTLANFIKTFVIGNTNLPNVTSSPTNVTVVSSSNTTFSVQASGPGTLSYSWYLNGTRIPGASSSSYTLSNAQIGNAGAYQAIVTNSSGSAASTLAFLSVIAPLTNGTGAAVAPSGLVDWWAGEGNTRDISGSYHGTPHYAFSYMAGKEGLGYRFDGFTSYISTAAPTLSSPWTLSMWVNRQAAVGTAAALMSDGTYSIKLEQYNGTQQVGITQLGVGDYAFPYTVPTNTWTHLAFVNNGSQTLLYANGVYKGATNAVPLPRAYIGATYVASNGNLVDYLAGGLDEIMVFNRALNGTEIASIANAGATGFVRVPYIPDAAPLAANQFQLNLRGMTGKSFSVYRSFDLDTWTKIGTVSNPTGNAVYVDTSATNDASFYRLTQP